MISCTAATGVHQPGSAAQQKCPVHGVRRYAPSRSAPMSTMPPPSIDVDLLEALNEERKGDEGISESSDSAALAEAMLDAADEIIATLRGAQRIREAHVAGAPECGCVDFAHSRNPRFCPGKVVKCRACGGDAPCVYVRALDGGR